MTPARISMTWPQYRRRECLRFGTRVHLAPKEAELLLLYLLRRGECLADGDAIAFLWPDVDAVPEFPSTALYGLRRNLTAKLPGTITVRRGFGGIIERPSTYIETVTVEPRQAA